MGGGSGAGGGGGANRRNRVEISRWRRAVLLVPFWNCMSERCGTGGTGTGRREKRNGKFSSGKIKSSNST